MTFILSSRVLPANNASDQATHGMLGKVPTPSLATCCLLSFSNVRSVQTLAYVPHLERATPHTIRTPKGRQGYAFGSGSSWSSGAVLPLIGTCKGTLVQDSVYGMTKHFSTCWSLGRRLSRAICYLAPARWVSSFRTPGIYGSHQKGRDSSCCNDLCISESNTSCGHALRPSRPHTPRKDELSCEVLTF